MIDRIGCLSYVPLGYGTPQIQYLLRSLHKYYQCSQPCGVVTPTWSNYPDIDGDFPDFFVQRLPSSGFRSFDLNDFLKSLIRYCRNHELSRIAFYGAGSHTKELLNLWCKLHGPPVTRILVTRPPEVAEFQGIPIVSIDEVDPFTLDFVLLSSASFETEMSETIKRAKPTLPFLAIYNEALSYLGKLPPPQRKPLINLDYYASWIDAFEPDLLVCTHYTYLGALVKAKHQPQTIVYYCLEHPGPTDGSALTDADKKVHELVKDRITEAIYPEAGRMHLYHSMFDFESVPSLLVFNARPEACSLPLPWNRRNGRILLQGSLLTGKTFVEYLPRARNSDIWIDAIGQTYSHTETLQILKNAEAGEKRHYRFLGFMTNNKLSEIRNSYAYSLIMWNPETFERLHACSNKFFEGVADAVPPICAPHPQCKEIVERFDCGILLKDWSYEGYTEALRYAQDIYGTERYRQLVDNCRTAQREICWERQFDKVTALLPPPSIHAMHRKPKFLLIDPTLQTEIGHHLTYAENVLLTAQKAGFETVAAINRNFHVRLGGADRLQPLFRHDFWGRDTGMCGKPWIPDSPRHFIETVGRLLEKETPTGSDQIFIPNISDSDLQELADFFACGRAPMESAWHVILRHDLPPDPGTRIAAVQRLWKLAAPKVCFYTDTEELSMQHENVTGVPFSTLPIPVMAEFSLLGVSDDHYPLTAAYVGDARREKGFCEMLSLIESSIDLMNSGRLRFSIQCNTPEPNQECKETMERLANLTIQYPVQLLTEPLSKEEYDRSIYAADIILALYDRHSYARRSSQVVMEALTCGKAVIVTRGTSSGSLLPPDCPWLVDHASTAAQRLRWIVENPSKSREISNRLQAQYGPTQTGSRLFETLIATASGKRSYQDLPLAASTL